MEKCLKSFKMACDQSALVINMQFLKAFFQGQVYKKGSQTEEQVGVCEKVTQAKIFTLGEKNSPGPHKTGNNWRI